MRLQNSKDNMSAVLVTFPAAPKVSSEAIEKVTGLVTDCLATTYSLGECGISR